MTVLLKVTFGILFLIIGLALGWKGLIHYTRAKNGELNSSLIGMFIGLVGFFITLGIIILSTWD